MSSVELMVHTLFEKTPDYDSHNAPIFELLKKQLRLVVKGVKIEVHMVLYQDDIYSLFEGQM